MKIEGSQGFIALALLMLSGCAPTITRPDGVKIPAAVYTYELAIDARKEDAKVAAANANMAATCDDAVKSEAPATPLSDIGRAVEALRTIGALAVCGQRVAKADTAITAPMPQYIAPPTFIDRIAQLAPLALGVGQLVASDRSNARQTQAGVDIARIGAQRELGLVQAATGSNERIASGGFNAVAGIAGAGFDALGNAATSANYASAANVQALASTISNLPPTTQTIAGGNIAQAGDDLDQSSTGRDRDVTRNTNCVANGGNGAPGTAGNNSSTGGAGATSPLTAGYNPLVSGGDGAAGSNNCGGG